MTVLYLDDQRARRGMPAAKPVDPQPYDECAMARAQVRRRLYDLCGETAIVLAELHAERLVRDGKFIYDAVNIAVERALSRMRPKPPPNDPLPPAA